MDGYVQLVAQHVRHPERLVLRDEHGQYYVWTGELPDANPQEMDAATVWWLCAQPQIAPLSHVGVWFHATDLPLTPTAAGGRRPAR